MAVKQEGRSVGEPTKPKGLKPDEEWAWNNTAPDSWQRRAIAWGAERRAQERRREERGEFAVFPGRMDKGNGRYIPDPKLTAKARARSPLYVRLGDLPEGGGPRPTAGGG